MKPIETNQILNFSDFRKYSDTFIETGTAAGGGIEASLGAGFTKIHSVEAKDTYYIDCVKRYVGIDAKLEDATPGRIFTKMDEGKTIDLYFGMSQDRMHEMIKDVDRPIVFWIDAHPSGPLSAGHDDLMKNGNDSQYAQDNVITAELKIILAHRKDHVILIDDQNGVNTENEKYIAMILEANPNYKFFFYDEKRGNDYYKNKCLACIPE